MSPGEGGLLAALAVLARSVGEELLEMQRAAAADQATPPAGRPAGGLQSLIVRRKGAADLVTWADLHAHARLREGLAAVDPSLPVVLEESERHDLPAGPYFVCDELDGTINFSRGRPEWGVSVARVEAGRPTHGAVCLPALGVAYAAELGGGCTLNGLPVHLRGAERLEDAVAGAELNPHHDAALRRRFVDPVTTRTLTSIVTACSVAAVADLLRGRTDLYLNCRGAKIWDFAATALAVAEAGGRTCDLDGRPLRWDAVDMGVLFAANEAIQRAALEAFGD